jgi:uncharacterized integral membrane protein (TIGR00697 family)
MDATFSAEKLDRAAAIAAHRFRFYEFLMAGACVIVVCSNIIGANKFGMVGSFTFASGVLFFPLSYVIGDVMTEVYGYARARRVAWASFAAAAFAAAMAAVVTAVPPAPEWNVDVAEGFTKQDAFALNFGQAPRIVLASCLAIWAGEIANAFILARMKVWTNGKHLWTRTIGSTAVGQGVDTLIFYPLAFIGEEPLSLIATVMASTYALKVGWEALLTPVTYRLVAFLKRAEGVDVYDKDTDFTPFTIKN